jgi:hypothetical protein
VRRLFGKLFGDRGYISQPLAEHLLIEPGIQLVTTLRKNMRERLLAVTDTLLLRKRAIIESINDQRKNVCQIDIPAITARSTSSFTCWLVSLPTATSPRNRRCISTATSWPGQGPSLSRIHVNYHSGRYGWVFSEVRLLEPIPLRGQQGLFDWTPPGELRYLGPRNVAKEARR